MDNNRAGGDGGGIANGIPLGGPMPLMGGPVTLNHSQVNGNSAADGGGIFNFGGTVALATTSITGNNPNNCEPQGPSPAASARDGGLRRRPHRPPPWPVSRTTSAPTGALCLAFSLSRFRRRAKAVETMSPNLSKLSHRPSLRLSRGKNIRRPRRPVYVESKNPLVDGSF